VEQPEQITRGKAVDRGPAKRAWCALPRETGAYVAGAASEAPALASPRTEARADGGSGLV
jgi:hypothetical protein